MAVDLAQLKSELADARYAGADDTNAAILLNTKDRDGALIVQTLDIKRALFLRGKWGAVKARAIAGDAAALTLMDALDVFQTFDMSNQVYATAITGALAANVQASNINQADMDAILALGAGLVSRAEELWGVGTVVGGGDVSRARGMR